MGTKQRIQIYGLNYAPEPSGSAPYTTALAEFLAANEYEMDVVVGQPYYPQWRKYRDTTNRNGPHIRVRRLNHPVPRSPRIVGRLLMEAAYAAQALAVRGKADLYVAASPALLGSLAVVLKSLVTSTPTVVWVQDIYTAGLREALDGGGLLGRLLGRLEAFVFCRANCVIAAHVGFLDTIGAMTKNRARVIVVPNWAHVGSDADAATPTMNQTEFLRRTRAPEGSLVLVHAGNIGVKQGLENLVATAREAHDNHPDLHFVMLGDGNERRRLELEADGLPNLTFLDPIPEDELLPFLNCADFLLVNEKVGVREMSIPSKLTTYWSTSTPVICCVDESGLTAREVRRAGAAEVVPAGRPAALIDAMTRLRGDTETCRELVENGRRYRAANLQSEASLRAIEDILVDVAEGPR